MLAAATDEIAVPSPFLSSQMPVDYAVTAVPSTPVVTPAPVASSAVTTADELRIVRNFLLQVGFEPIKVNNKSYEELRGYLGGKLDF